MNNDNNIQNQVNTNVVPAQPQVVPVQQPVVTSQPVQSTPVQPVQTPVVPVQSTPVQPVQTPVAPVQSVPVQQPVAPVVENSIPIAAEATVINNDIPVAAEAEVIPSAAAPTIVEEQIVLDNSEKKSGSNFILIILVLLLIVGLMYAEEIMTFVENNIISSNPTGVGEGTGDSLVGGYILLNDVSGNMTVNSIKFYNFKKNSDNFSIGLNYESNVEFKDIASENVYIEIYTANKELLYKHLFNTGEKISKNVVRIYSIQLDADVYESAYYALVKTYSANELSKVTNLSCKYRVSNEGYNELYKHIFTFKGDMLASYSVDKKVEVISTSTSSTVALNNLKSEYDALVTAQLPVTYSEGSLVYSIDLEKLNADYIPLYKKGTSMLSVKNKEVFKKWECE